MCIRDRSLPDEEIVVVTRDLSGGAHEVFQKKIMKETKVKQDAIQAPSMGALVSKIIENKNAIDMYKRQIKRSCNW